MGLPKPLQAQARKATLPITVEADGIGRYPQDTEAALSILSANRACLGHAGP
jgi:hypothetical protein